MELLLNVSLKIEVRVVICYLKALDIKGAAIVRKIKDVYDEVMSTND